MIQFYIPWEGEGGLWWKFEIKTQDRILSKNNNPGLVFFLKLIIWNIDIHNLAFWTAHFCVHTCSGTKEIINNLYASISYKIINEKPITYKDTIINLSFIGKSNDSYIFYWTENVIERNEYWLTFHFIRQITSTNIQRLQYFGMKKSCFEKFELDFDKENLIFNSVPFFEFLICDKLCTIRKMCVIIKT